MSAAVMEELHGFHAEVEANRRAGQIHPPAVEQLSDLWFLLRIGRITGSRIGPILGFNAFGKKAEDVMRDMVREYYGLPSEFTGNIATEWGTQHEPEAREALSDKLGVFIVETGIHIHPDYPWLAESPDGLVGLDQCTQIKAPFGQRNASRPQFKELADMPSYAAQVQLGLACTGRDVCHFFQWAPHGSSNEPIERDPNWLEQNFEALQAFHDRYLSIIADPELAAPYLEDREVVREDSAWLRQARRYVELKERADAIDDDMKAIKADLEAMAVNRTTRGGGVIAMRAVKSGSISGSALIKKYGDRFTEEELEACRGKDSETFSIRIERPKEEA